MRLGGECGENGNRPWGKGQLKHCRLLGIYPGLFRTKSVAASINEPGTRQDVQGFVVVQRNEALEKEV